MAKVIARVRGVALRPGVSRNKRLYTAEAIAKAVARAQARIAEGVEPMTCLTHHLAGDDSTRIVGRLTGVSLEADGSATYEAELADTEHGRTILDLIDTSDGEPAFLAGSSIRGAWASPVQRKVHNGETVETASDLELDGVDFTKSPGVPGAGIGAVTRVGGGSPAESGDERALIFESFDDPSVTILEDGDMECKLVDGRCECSESGGPAPFADPGYQDDKAKRYPVGDKKHALAAHSYIGNKKNAARYTGPQLKQVKGRIDKALRKHGVKVNTQEGWISTGAFKIEEGGPGMAPGGVPIAPVDPFAVPPLGSFCAVLNNRIVTVTVSSHLIDPADLEVVGAAAMRAANAAIKVMDPDEDGDIDIPGASGNDAPDIGATPVSVLMPGGYESAPSPSTEAPDAASATGTTTETEAPAMAEPTIPAVAPAASPAAESAPVAPAVPVVEAVAPSAVEVKLDALTAAITGLVGHLSAPAPAAAPVEAAPVAPAPVVEAVAPVVQETTEQMVQRLVAEGIQSGLTKAVQEHVAQNGVQRKGLVVNENAPDGGPVGQAGLPAEWPQKPLHQYTPEERKTYLDVSLEAGVMGPRSVYRQGA